jgi:hypothetical protein
MCDLLKEISTLWNNTPPFYYNFKSRDIIYWKINKFIIIIIIISWVSNTRLWILEVTPGVSGYVHYSLLLMITVYPYYL